VLYISHDEDRPPGLSEAAGFGEARHSGATWDASEMRGRFFYLDSP
jgi:hypothetical protein